MAKSKRVSNIAEKALLDQAYGDQPSLVGLEVGTDEYRLVSTQMLNWANAMLEPIELKDYFVKREGKKFASVEEYEFNTIGALAYFMSAGETLSDETMSWYNTKIEALVEKYALDSIEKSVEETTPRVTTNILTYYNARNELADMVEERTVRQDDDNIVYNFLVGFKGNKFVFKKIKEYVAEVVLELTSARSEETAEYFENVSDETLNVDLEQYKTISTMLSNIEENGKSTRRKPRKWIVSSEKITKNVKFKKDDDSVNISSINPSTIVGAAALLVFNTKTRKLGIYYASDASGLSMKGTTIQNFSESRSVAKTVRKPMDVLPRFRKGTRIRRWDVMLDDINSKPQSLNGRVNGDTLLVKVLGE